MKAAHPTPGITPGLTTDDVAAAVGSAIARVLVETGRQPVTIEPALLLGADVGLDSLDLAQTIVLLERRFGVDPFRAASGPRPSLRTVRDLVDLYVAALGPCRPVHGPD